MEGFGVLITNVGIGWWRATYQPGGGFPEAQIGPIIVGIGDRVFFSLPAAGAYVGTLIVEKIDGVTAPITVLDSMVGDFLSNPIPDGSLLVANLGAKTFSITEPQAAGISPATWLLAGTSITAVVLAAVLGRRR